MDNKTPSEPSLLELCNRAKPYLAVIFLQFGSAVLAILAKSALNRGMSHFTFAVYRNVVASVIFAPFAFYFERKIRPQMTVSIFFKIMLLGLLEPVIDQNLYYAGMKFTTATFSTAMCNILPAITFLMAWIFRLEKVNIKTKYGQSKILGTLVTVGGAMIMTLIRGPTIGLPWSKELTHSDITSSVNHQDPIKGSLMITAGCFCWASFYILQAITLKSYPASLSLTTLLCMMGALQGSILTLVIEKGNTAIWSIQWDIKFLTAIYAGIMCSGVNYYVSGLIMKKRGPVFVTAFNPLGMVIVAIMGSFFLAEKLNLGRVLGAMVIVAGLYLVIWGKCKDQRLSESHKDQVLPIHHKMATTNGATTDSQHNYVDLSRKIPNGEAI